MDEEKNNEQGVVNTNTTVNANANNNSEKKGFNITSMILGIVSIVFFCFWYVSLPCSIMAIIFSIAGKHNGGRGMGVAGLILGIIALVLLIVIFVLGIIAAGAGLSFLNNFDFNTLSSSVYY